MADNVTLPGTAEVVAADDVGGAKHQRVKIEWGVDGSVVDASATNPLPVVLGAGTAEVGKLAAGTAEIGKLGAGTAEIGKLGAGTAEIGKLAAGEAHVGAIGGNTTVITVPVVMTTHANYVANDFVGADNTALIFANAARVNAGTGIVQSAVLIDYALQNVLGELWLFDTAPAGLPVDSAAFTLTDAAVCIGVIEFARYFTNALNSVSNGYIPNGGIGFKSSGTSLWGAFVTRGAPAYASSDLQIRLTILQD